MTERSVQPSTTPQENPDPGTGGTAIRPGFAERLQAKLSSSVDEQDTQADGPVLTKRPKAPKPPKAAKVPKATRPSRGPRRARLRLTRIDPWSVMKASFLLSIAFGIVTVVAVAMILQVLQAAGVWDSINQTVKDSIGGQDVSTFDIRNYLGTDRVLGFTMLVAAVDVILLTAIATLGAFLYNMSAALLGGIELTLAEDD